VATDAQLLIVIRRGCEDLYARLATRYPGAVVLVDRRRNRDRVLSAERRQPPTWATREMWDRFGYRFVYQGGADGIPTVQPASRT
jgi:hypothetical protein